MIVVQTIEDLRKFRREAAGKSLGLVPTMGFLHDGHISLVKRARAENEKVGVSIFVNPAQFNDPTDLAAYPKDIEKDLAMLRAEGVDLVWTPAPETVYPAGFQTHVAVGEITRQLEGAARPGHFQGVTTVVAKLFNLFQPQRAYFGQKDAQQLAVIRQMVLDLNIDTEVIGCPIVREGDGLAMSSRNALLSAEARGQATCLYQALCAARTAVDDGERNAEVLKQMMRQIIDRAALAKVDYISIADRRSLIELQQIDAGALISLAVFLGEVRLIDNLVIETELPRETL